MSDLFNTTVEMARATNSPVFDPSAGLKQTANIFLSVTSFRATTGRCALLANSVFAKVQNLTTNYLLLFSPFFHSNSVPFHFFPRKSVNHIMNQSKHRVANLPEILAFFQRTWLFWLFFSREGLGSGKTLSELHINYKSLLRRIDISVMASQLWCNFRKSYMQRLRVAYNFRCRALYNLPWRASVSNHQVQCNIPAFEVLLWKYTYMFLERCKRSNNVWLRALIQSDCLYSSLLFEHYNRILLCEWVNELCSVRLIDCVSSHNAFEFYLESTNLGLSTLLRSSAATSVTCQLTIVLRMCLQPYGSVFNPVAKSVCNPVILPASVLCTTFCFVCLYQPALCSVCVFVLWTLCLLTDK